MTSIERELGNLQARIETVESELHAMRDDVREIRDAMVAARTGWRMLRIVTGCGLRFISMTA